MPSSRIRCVVSECRSITTARWSRRSTLRVSTRWRAVAYGRQARKTPRERKESFQALMRNLRREGTVLGAHETRTSLGPTPHRDPPSTPSSVGILESSTAVVIVSRRESFHSGGGSFTMHRHLSFVRLWVLGLALGVSASARAEVPYPSCESTGCSDPVDFAAYLFRRPGELPNDFDRSSGSSWTYERFIGMNVLGAWKLSTGRPDVVVAVLDSGIRWNRADLARKIALNVSELPPPPACSVHDCNGDGLVNVEDYRGVADANGNGLLDAQDLLKAFSNGVDDDGNGYVDDIAGWDFFEDDNDPGDDVDFGHGTGQAGNALAEAGNGEGMPGVAPSAMFMPLRVGDSFVAVGSDFAQAVVYAVDRGVSVVSEALGALSASPTSQAAIDYAYRRGVPVVASAADEESRHHNFPSGLDHTIWVNSVVHGDGVGVRQKRKYDLLNGCTNFGGRAWVAISSNGCSSEATARASGLVALLVSRGKNLIDEGKLSPYPGLATPFSAEEIRQLLRESARDVDHEANLDDVSLLGPLSRLLSAPLEGLIFQSRRFPTQAGWDQYTGYGRPDALRLLRVRAETLPPEADLSGGLEWFDIVDPRRSPSVPVVGIRRGGARGRSVRLRRGRRLRSATERFRPSRDGPTWVRLRREVLAVWHPGETASLCGFDPEATVQEPDEHTVTLRLRVVDRRGNLGEDRRTVAIHADASLSRAPVTAGSSLESSPVLVDVNRDGVLDVVFAASDGRVHALRGDTGVELRGFPARTDPLPVHPSRAYASGEVPIPHEAILAPLAADDLDGDGRVEIVAASIEGRLYVFDDRGRRRPGFPVTTDPRFSLPARRNPLNDTDPGILAAPTLADLNGEVRRPRLEILAVGARRTSLRAGIVSGSPCGAFPSASRIERRSTSIRSPGSRLPSQASTRVSGRRSS